eukprot:218560-Hanusia_phi.AAC.1
MARGSFWTSPHLIHNTIKFATIPVVAFLTRRLWCGNPSPPEDLAERYKYLQEVTDHNKKALQASIPSSVSIFVSCHLHVPVRGFWCRVSVQRTDARRSRGGWIEHLLPPPLRQES